jgi:ABC-2 type transport system ATP-binding protein
VRRSAISLATVAGTGCARLPAVPTPSPQPADMAPPTTAPAAPAGPLVIETHALTKRFGARNAVEGVDLQVPLGCAFGFLGPNGAGKTTLIRMLLGLTRASAGTIRLRGCDVPQQKSEALQRVGAIVEEPRFVPYLSGRQNLRVIAAAREPAAHDRIDGALERVGLTARADDRVKSYSLGMRQRLGVARCLLADPELLILDEPMNGLDPAGIHEFRQMVRALVGEGRTVFLSSHLLDEVEKTCDLVAVIDGGKVVQQGAIGSIGREAGSAVVSFGCDRPVEGASLVKAREAELGVESGEMVADGFVLHLKVGADAAAPAIAAINAALVGAGFAVFRVELVRASLEDRFLSMTSRLEAGK